MKSEILTSAQNPKVKLLQELTQKSSERRKRGLFVVEGRREVERCAANGYVLDTVFCCPEIYGKAWEQAGAEKVITFGSIRGAYDVWIHDGGGDATIKKLQKLCHSAMKGTRA